MIHMPQSLRCLLTGLAMLVMTNPVFATSLEYTLDALGGSSYRYNYTLFNDTLAVPIEGLSVYFDLGLYDNLSSPTAPSGWDPLVFQPDAGLSADGIYDIFNMPNPLAPGASLGLLSVEFDWLGGASGPGPQSFDIFDSAFEVLDSGSSHPARTDGDLNSDGVVNAADVLVALRIISGELSATQLELDHGDVYPPDEPDGVVDISDLLIIQRKVLGLEVEVEVDAGAIAVSGH
jgi:hypothetical protein